MFLAEFISPHSFLSPKNGGFRSRHPVRWVDLIAIFGTFLFPAGVTRLVYRHSVAYFFLEHSI